MRVNREKLACLLIQHDMSVNGLVERSGLTRSTVSAVRSGKSCSVNTAKKLAEALGVRTEDLVEVRR